MTDFSPAAVEQRVQASIRPTLSRAERYVWELQHPRTAPGLHDPDHEKFHRHQIYVNPATGELWLEPIAPSEWWTPAYHNRLQPEFHTGLW